MLSETPMSLQTTKQYILALPYRLSAWWYGQKEEDPFDAFEQKLLKTTVIMSQTAQDNAIQQARAMGNTALAERLESIRRS
jgi:hypothetical protein